MQDNQYNPKTGMIEGDHLRHLAKHGIHGIVDRVNRLIPGDQRLTDEALPSKLRDLIEQAGKLATQLERCESVPLAMGPEYVKKQAKIAADALPLARAELDRRQQAALDALSDLRRNLSGKNPLVAAGVEVLLQRNPDIQGAIEAEAQLLAWRTAAAICRDAATGKTIPRWLSVMIAQHEAHKAASAAA